MTTESDIAALLHSFAHEVNGGEVNAALARFSDDPVIVEDLAPFVWRGAGAGLAWLGAMAANAERQGMSGIHMAFGAPTLILVEDDRAYAALPGDLTYAFADSPDRRVQGYATFALARRDGAWKIETLTWAWAREA